MLKKCEKAGIFFKGKKLEKDEVIKIENESELGHLSGMFSDIIETDNTVFENIFDDKKINKKPKKGGRV